MSEEKKTPVIQVIEDEASQRKALSDKFTREGFKVIESKDGKRTRVRVGPFESKALADKTAEKIKKLNLPTAILEL